MEEASVVNIQGEDLADLPPGFRFHPTDEEIITHYLTEKVVNINFIATAIGEADLNKCEPWDLPKKAKMGEKEWYFFCQRDRKYPTGMRTNRATESGYWKATGKDKEIYKGKGRLVGMKKTLVFYRGRAPKGEKTNWVMHEYRLEGKFSYYNFPKAAKDEWVVCRIFHKNSGIKKSPGLTRVNSFGDDLFIDSDPSLPPLMDPVNYSNENNRPGSSSFHDGEDKFKGTTVAPLARFMSDGNYLPYFPMNNHHQPQDHKSFPMLPTNNNNYFNNNYGATLPLSNPTPNSNLYSHPNPISSFQASPYPAYLYQDKSTSSNSIPSFGFKGVHHETFGIERQCKVEQFSSNHSMVTLSQDTGLSTDMNNEISSVVSKHEMGSSRNYDDFEGPSQSVGPMVDLDCLWDY